MRMPITTFVNKTLRKLNLLLHSIYYRVVSIVEYCYIVSIGIKIGSHCQFRGWVNVFKGNESDIIIGEKCSFNRSAYSNHIGLNHACILATYRSGAKIIIGNNVGMSSSTINCWKSVTIGNDVRIGANCVIMDADFHLDDPRSGNPQNIVIEDNVWLGANVTVMKGVKIGKNSIIGMGSIVTKDIPENCIAVGIPSRVIRKLSERDL